MFKVTILVNFDLKSGFELTIPWIPHMHISVYACLCLHVYKHACVLVYLYMCVNVSVHACVCVCVCMSEGLFMCKSVVWQT